MQISNRTIVDTPFGALRELDALGLNIEIIRTIAEAAAGAKAEALPIDPLSSPGTLAYIHGVRSIRRALLPKGWRVGRGGNVEATIHDQLGIQLLFQNVDRACSNKDPQAISKKGAGSRKLIQAGLQDELFEGNQPLSLEKIGSKPVVWLVCVSSDENGMQAEVSCPDIFNGDQFENFTKRIFVIDDKFEPIVFDANKDLDDGGGVENFEILISKKQ